MRILQNIRFSGQENNVVANYLQRNLQILLALSYPKPTQVRQCSTLRRLSEYRRRNSANCFRNFEEKKDLLQSRCHKIRKCNCLPKTQLFANLKKSRIRSELCPMAVNKTSSICCEFNNCSMTVLTIRILWQRNSLSTNYGPA